MQTLLFPLPVHKVKTGQGTFQKECWVAPYIITYVTSALSNGVYFHPRNPHLCFSNFICHSFMRYAISNLDSSHCRFPLREMNGRMLFIASGMVGLVRALAQSARTTSGVADYPCSFLSSGVVRYGSNSKIAQYKAMVELNPPPVQLMRVDYPKALWYREDNVFLRSRDYPGTQWGTSSFEWRVHTVLGNPH